MSRDFHKLLKMQSAKQGLSIIEYTDRLAKDSVSFVVEKPRKRKGGSSVFFKW